MLLALSGAKNSGKDVVGEYLVKKYGFKRIAFADKLKKSVTALFDIDASLLEELKNSNDTIMFFDKNGNAWFSMTFRELLQRYGTEAHRDVFGKDFWIDHALKGINPNDDIVITDCRFENEIEKVKSLGGEIARIVREDLVSKDSHSSEVEPPLHLIDYFLINDKTLEDLYNEVDDLINWIFEDNTSEEFVEVYEY
jgi:dephospho-CoA kinase